MNFRAFPSRFAVAVMTSLTLSAFAGLALPPRAEAKAYVFKFVEPPFQITIPDTWTIERLSSGIHTHSPKEEVLIWIEAATPETVGGLMDEYKSYFSKQKVTFTGPMTKKEFEMNGRFVVEMSFPAQYKRKDTIIKIALIARTEKSLVLLGYWAEDSDADAAFDPDVNRILADLVAR